MGCGLADGHGSGQHLGNAVMECVGEPERGLAEGLNWESRAW